MKTYIITILMLTICLSCHDDDESSFDAIPFDEYYSEDPLKDISMDFFNGDWEAIKRQQSGIAGIINLPKDFDYLKIKPNGIFSIQIDNNLVTTGKIKIKDSTEGQILFIPETEGLDIDILRPGIISIFPIFNSDNTEVVLHYSTSATVLKKIN